MRQPVFRDPFEDLPVLQFFGEDQSVRKRHRSKQLDHEDEMPPTPCDPVEASGDIDQNMEQDAEAGEGQPVERKILQRRRCRQQKSRGALKGRRSRSVHLFQGSRRSSKRLRPCPNSGRSVDCPGHRPPGRGQDADEARIYRPGRRREDGRSPERDAPDEDPGSSPEATQARSSTQSPGSQAEGRTVRAQR